VEADDTPLRNAGLAGEKWTPEIAQATGAKAAHPNARSQCRRISARRLIHRGKMPKAYLSRHRFGGRRASTMPLVFQSFNWSSGVYIGATIGDDSGCSG